MISPERIWKSPDLPTLPTVAVKLLELSKNVESGIADFVGVLRTDPAISARLIKTANSSYFGFATRVSSVEAAVPLLGTTMVTSLALSFSLVPESDGASTKDHFRRFWSRSLLQAVTVEHLARKHRWGHVGEYFLAGLLCDLGILAQMRTIPFAYVEVLQRAHVQRRPLLDVEREQLGFDHIEVGSQLMMTWKMPEPLVDAVKYHHATQQEMQQLQSLPHLQIVRATRFAACVGDYFEQEARAETSEQLQSFAQAWYQLDDSDLQALLEDVRNRTDDAAKLLSVDTKDLPVAAELLARANAQLAEIAVREHVAKVLVAAQTTALEQQNKDLRERANRLKLDAAIDGLTGVANRRAFDENYEEVLSASLNRGRPAGVIFADVDNFKRLNDTHGHPFGDSVLQRVAGILKEATRESDFIARYGGEEFVLVLANCTEHAIQTVAERVRSNVEQEPFEHDGKQVQVTISVGGSIVSPERAGFADTSALARRMLKDADTAMYYCKHHGRNRTQLHICGVGEEQQCPSLTP